MSHAVVAAPIILSGGGLLALAATVAVTVAVPVLVGAVLESVAKSVERAEAKERRRVAKILHSDIVESLNSLKKGMEHAEVSDVQRLQLAKEFEKLAGMPEKVSVKVANGTFSSDDVSVMKDAMEKFSAKIAHAKGKLQENLRLKKFHGEQIEKYIAQILEKYDRSSPMIVGLRQKNEAILAIPDSGIEEKVSQMLEFSAKLASMLDKLVMDKILAGFSKGTEKAAARSPKGPQGPSPDRPSSPVDKLIAKLAKIKKAQQEIEFYFSRLREAAPEKVTLNLEKLVEEAGTSDFFERIAAIRDEVKMTYQKVHETAYLSAYFKEKLQACLSIVNRDSDLYGKIQEAVSAPVVSSETYQKLFAGIETELARTLEQQKRKIIEEKVRSGLAQLDYVVTDSSLEEDIAARLHKGEIVMVETKYDDYKLLVRMGKDDSLAIRLVRVVANEREKSEISEFQQKKDKELMSEWCKNLDRFRDKLQEAGVVLCEQLRVEDKVDYLTIEQMEQQKIDVSRLRKTGKSAQRIQQTRRKE